MIIVILAAAAVSASAPAGPQIATPQSAATSFYGAYLGSTAGAFPGPRARWRLRPLLSPRLNLLLERVDRAEAEHARRTRDQEAPLIEGDVFTSLFEGAGRFHVIRCRTGSMRAICQVGLSYDASRQRPASWQDQLVLMRGPSGWLVDDVIYGAHWSFGNKGRLSQSLRSAISGE